MKRVMRTLEDLAFDNVYLKLPAVFYNKINPTPVSNPYLVSFNSEAANLIDLDVQNVKDNEQSAVNYFSGNTLLKGSEPAAMAYAGYQFGYLNLLGDGRAILLGQVRNQNGELWDLHLKGSGQTGSFSRGFDGRAVLRSTIREYLCSEAMHHLGIPTTRALCITGSDDPVERETMETSAMLIRLAQSHVRFGSFDLFNARKQYDHVKTLADYVISNFYSHLSEHEEKYYELFKTIVERTALMIAKWQAVGFAHGVMNTDNMSILGLTLDYGPFGFLDKYDPEFICNHSDNEGRYAFDKQPDIALWNLERLSVGMSSLPGLTRDRESNIVRLKQLLIVDYKKVFGEIYANEMRKKLGFLETKEEGDGYMIEKLMYVLQASGGMDYTNFFRQLSRFETKEEFIELLKKNVLRNSSERQVSLLSDWLDTYAKRIENLDRDARVKQMNDSNPKFIPRNHILQQAIEKAEKKDYSEVEKLLKLYRSPFEEHEGMEEYTNEPPPSLKLCISCSS